ncbi:MAG TPA: BatD family protein [Flavobacteriales bacterium]|jgi:hypothetical protein|nr:BatD family protein [Flavobacteriales bacterium]
MRSIHLLFLLGLSTLLQAQDSLIVTSYLPPYVRIGQVYTVTYVVPGVVQDYKELLVSSGFEVLGGPSTSSSTNMKDGKTEQVMYYSYSLKVAGSGALELPLFQAKVDGRWHTSLPVHTTALDETAPTPTPTAMSEALVICQEPEGTVSAYVHKDGGYLAVRQDGELHLLRYLTDKEAAELEQHLRKLAEKK